MHKADNGAGSVIIAIKSVRRIFGFGEVDRRVGEFL